MELPDLDSLTVEQLYAEHQRRDALIMELQAEKLPLKLKIIELEHAKKRPGNPDLAQKVG